jgi:signal recognition particle subunit SRP54
LDEVKTLLLDADVNYDVVKKFIISIRSKSIGSVIEANDDPQKVLLSIIKSELVEILGKDLKQIDVSSRLTKIMLVGLNGSGKTTSCGKIAYYYKNKLNKKPLLVAIDIYRPAAIEQLRVLAQSSNIDFFEKGQQNPVITVKEALEFGEKNGNDIVIFDTAGRMQTNEELMNELEEVKVKIHPDEILFTADAMSGQDIINVANEFNNRLELTGFVVTKLDTDAKAGAVLSLISLLDVGVKFSGNGEKISNLELFYPERIANRILGLGDILSISEQAKEKVDEEKTKKSFARMMSGKMDLEDLMVQMQQISKVGSMSSIMKMMPNMPKIGENQIGEAENKMRV